MKWRLCRTCDTDALAEKADTQAEDAREEYEKTMQKEGVIREALEVFFYHAQQNNIVENFQKVVKGH